MIDTIKISLDVHPSVFTDNKNFNGFSTMFLQQNSSFTKTALNNNSKNDEYLPRLTLYKRQTNNSIVYQLFAEFSAPKLFFGNNFDELTDTDFEPLLIVLQQKLRVVTGYSFTIESLRTAPVSVCHYSKNFMFRDYTSCLTILDALSKQDISRVYDMQWTRYRQGHALQFHTNSLDISFYDKIAELQQANISPKRSIEPHAFRQKVLLEKLLAYKPLDVFRYEVRLANRTKIKRRLPELNAWNFQTLFSSTISQKILMSYWEEFTNKTDLLSLDSSKPMEILQNYLIENPSSTMQDALKATASILIVNQAGYRQLQQLTNKISGPHTWYRLKPTLKPPNAHRYKALQAISEGLSRFAPVRLPP